MATKPPKTPKDGDGWISRLDAIALCGGVNAKTFDRWRKLPGFPKERKASPESRLIFYNLREFLAWMARRS